MCNRNKINRLFGLAFLIMLWTISGSILLAQTPLITLSNYVIPLNSKGAYIASICSHLKADQPVKIVADTAKLFALDKNGKIYLRKSKLVRASDGIRAYGITLELARKRYEVELVKDEFLRNKVIAHRGAWRAQRVMQNSIRSFQRAVALGCACSEFDVWLSEDRQVVLSHDAHIGGLSVEQSTAEELYNATLKGGDPVPTLIDFIKLAKQQNQTKMILEIKSSPMGRTLELADSVLAIVHRLKAQGYIEYISFDYAVLCHIVARDPSARAAYLYGNKTVDELKADGLTGLDYDFYHYRNDPTLIKRAKAAGLWTNVWTVNTVEELNKYLDSEVDWITTDEPEHLLKLINEQKNKNLDDE